jgi:predicted lipoprotein with Yx(FWY)xxD motif
MKNKEFSGLFAFLFVVLLLNCGCVQEGAPETTTSTGRQTPSTVAGQAIIKSAQTPAGEILIDGSGMVLYTYKNDAKQASNCYDQCAVKWPPVYVDGEIRSSSSIKADIATSVRNDGRMQATYKGLPLYYYSGDQNPGDTNGDGLEGLWSLAVTGKVSSTNADEPSSTVPVATTAPDHKTINVNIQSFAFSPQEVKINRGDTVVWTNSDSAPHTVSSDSGKELDSGTLSKGQTFSHTFDSAGTFAYHCSNHPSMKAKVTTVA